MAVRPDRSWRHKWLDRAALEQAEQASSPALPYFTAAGRVTETSRGNLFWRDEDRAVVYAAAGRAGAARGHPA